MSQHDYDIANQSAPTFRSDLNLGLKALASCSSGTTAPTSTYANMLWYDTTNNILKMRSEADDAWITLFHLDQSANAMRIADGTPVWDGAVETGLLDTHANATWETGTDTSNRLVSPNRVRLAIESLSGLVARITLNQATNAIINSFGVASIANQATGRTRITLSNTQPSNQYQVLCTTTGQGGDVTALWSNTANFGAATNKTTAYFDIYSTTGGGSATNSEYVSVLVFGDK
jgi:hypothetical protein